MGSDSSPPHRGLLSAAQASAATLAPTAGNALAAHPTKPAEPSSNDPIFAAIEAHRRAVAARFRKRGAVESDVYEEAVAHESGMLAALFETAPTTFAGLVAFFQHLSWSLPGTHKSVIDAMIGMWEHGGWEPDAKQWVVLMELALRRIAATA